MEQEDPMEAALRNQLVLQHIFSCLPWRNLKQCRLVSKNWNFEIQSYIRAFCRCDAKISEENPCPDLNALAELAALPVLIINSLTIDLSSPVHSICLVLENESLYSELVKKLSLRYLDIRLDGDYCVRAIQCPAINFVINLLHRKLTNLHSLSLSLVGVPLKMQSLYFGQGWT